MDNTLYFAKKAITYNTTNENFILHSHSDYELLLFIQGDTNYIIEENVYKLKPYDLVIQRKGEMHRLFHNSTATYERIFINISPDFFIKNNCKELETEFLKETYGSMNRINAETCISSGVYDAFLRLQKYSNNFENMYTPISNAIITERLYLINNTALFSKNDTPDNLIKSVIAYINKNYTNTISLDALAEEFFVSKCHLCRTFKEHTGLTVYNYITSKRLLKAGELVNAGSTLSTAATLAGFNDYSSFYRAYVKNYGHAPTNK